MKTLKLFLFALMAIFMGQTSFAQTLVRNWYAPVLPNSERINFDYDFGSDNVRLDFWKNNISQGTGQQTAMPSIYNVTSNGTMEYDIPNLNSGNGYGWILLVNAVKNGQIVASVQFGGETGYAFNTLAASFYVYDTWNTQGGATIFRVNAGYGTGFPGVIPVLKFYMHDLTTGQTDVLVDTMTWWFSYAVEFSYVPEPGHFYTYCAEIFYSDAGGLPLWTNEFIVGSCSEPIPYPYAMTTGFDGVISQAEAFEAYPNPATDVITVEGFNHDLPIEVRDVTGRLVSSQKLLTSSMDISGLTPGVYFLSQSDGRSFRLVKNP